MHRFSDEVLNQVRSLREALTDLLSTYARMGANHPERLWLKERIGQLAAEISLRDGRAGSTGGLTEGACARPPFPH
jgi:hypothetical protein